MTRTSDQPTEAETVAKAFGGFTRLHEALLAAGVDASVKTIHAWTRSKSGLVPRWWRRDIIRAAKILDVTLPEEFEPKGVA